MPSTSHVQSPAAATPETSAGQVRRPARREIILRGAVLVLMVFLIYAPVLSAGFIWDDEENIVTNETLRSLDGLRQMWPVPRSIQQYYPLMYTRYWLEYHVWGLAPAGYHLVNIALHATAVLLVWRVLVRLSVPGAWLAAALFAVHPVVVESVAWVTERKNVLSLSLALVSMLCWLRFALADEAQAEASSNAARRWRWYALSLVVFALALTAKTVVVTLPPVLLVLQWWRQGRITRRGVLCTLPFFALSIAAGLITTWMETVHLGARGAQWSLTPLERFLLAGRGLWFYVGKLVWPWPLAFFYPRFTIDAHAAWQYLFPLAALAVPLALYGARDRIGRGPLAAVLIYVGVLFPMLGFFNIYYALYAQVSDHFQYHACVALFAFAAAAITTALPRLAPAGRQAGYAAVGGWLLVLAIISVQQTAIYHDLETLYRDTIAKNPSGTIAYSNLGVYLDNRGESSEAIALAREVLRLDPRDPLAHTNLAVFLLHQGQREGIKPDQLSEAIEHLERGLELAHEAWGSAPDEPRVRTQLAAALLQQAAQQGNPSLKIDAAIAQLATALQLDPSYVDAEIYLAISCATAGRAPDAVAHTQRALELAPQDEERLRAMLGPALVAEAHNSLATTLAGRGDLRGAARHFEAAIQLRPDFDRALNNLGAVLMNLGETDRAIHYFQEAVTQNPDYVEARANLERAEKMRRSPSSPAPPEKSQ
ncbi:MAG: tetratricopeptide repeat protein [Singulisphaera sp.]